MSRSTLPQGTGWSLIMTAGQLVSSDEAASASFDIQNGQIGGAISYNKGGETSVQPKLQVNVTGAGWIDCYDAESLVANDARVNIFGASGTAAISATTTAAYPSMFKTAQMPLASGEYRVVVTTVGTKNGSTALSLFVNMGRG